MNLIIYPHSEIKSLVKSAHGGGIGYSQKVFIGYICFSGKNFKPAFPTGNFKFNLHSKSKKRNSFFMRIGYINKAVSQFYNFTLEENFILHCFNCTYRIKVDAGQ